MKSNSFPIWFFFLVSTLKEQLEDMRKISQNSQASNDKIVQLQNQVYSRHTHTHASAHTHSLDEWRTMH